MYKLTSENLTNVGGPMGNNSSSTNWVKFFKSDVKACDAAEKDYGDTLAWFDNGRGGITTGDLRYVMYDIEKVKVET